MLSVGEAIHDQPRPYWQHALEHAAHDLRDGLTVGASTMSIVMLHSANSARLLVPMDLIPRFQIPHFPWWVGGRRQLTIVV